MCGDRTVDLAAEDNVRTECVEREDVAQQSVRYSRLFTPCSSCWPIYVASSALLLSHSSANTAVIELIHLSFTHTSSPPFSCTDDLGKKVRNTQHEVDEECWY